MADEVLVAEAPRGMSQLRRVLDTFVAPTAPYTFRGFAGTNIQRASSRRIPPGFMQATCPRPKQRPNIRCKAKSHRASVETLD